MLPEWTSWIQEPESNESKRRFVACLVVLDNHQLCGWTTQPFTGLSLSKQGIRHISHMTQSTEIKGGSVQFWPGKKGAKRIESQERQVQD